MKTKMNQVRTDGVIKVIPGDRFTPYTLARKLDAKVVLESSSFKKGRERYSILLVREAFTLTQEEEGIFLEADGKRFTVKSKGKDILDVLEYFSSQQPALHQDLPLPTGGVGYLSYEFCRRCDSFSLQEKPDDLQLPEAAFLFGHVFVIFDHYTDILYLIGVNYREHQIDLPKAVEEVRRKIHDLDFNYLADAEEDYPVEVLQNDPESDKAEYMAGVERIREEIIRGNLLQAVLSRRIQVRTELPAIEAYRKLRSENPSPYLFYLDFGSFQLFGSSPEVHVKVKDGKVLMRPIAGTRRRGASADEDGKLETELLEDRKEQAEHLMLVDLARNDIGRIARAGSVQLSEFMGVERYSHVMHIVSQVEGALEPERTAIDAVRATFPAGTVSGAPKIRAVGVLSEIEPVKRGFYAGLVGYMESGGTLDTCITIRSGVKKDGVITLQVGAGIVYDSVPEREYEETCEKLRVLAKSIGVEV